MIYLAFLLCFSFLFAEIVVENRKVFFPEFPKAFNPSLIEYGNGYLLSFRYTPERSDFISYIGVCLLDASLEPISTPEILLTRNRNSVTQSQSEDARLFNYRGRVFVIYNDNIDLNNPSIYDRRDIFIAEILCVNNQFVFSSPLKLFCKEKQSQQWQKNWVPFEWNQILYLAYSINPHEILYANLIDGQCYSCFNSSFLNTWDFGSLRGSSSATLVDGEYLAFFHSGKYMATPASYDYAAWHYYMGAYTFGPNPPFQITRISKEPIIADGFYEPNTSWKKVIFPGGYVVKGDYIHVAYGKDDSEIWIATLDKAALMESLAEP